MYKKRKFIKFRVEQSPQKTIFDSFYGKPGSPNKSTNFDCYHGNSTLNNNSEIK